jgi:hypothetical protein
MTNWIRADVKRSTGRTRHFLAEMVGDTPVPQKEMPIPAWVEIRDHDGSFYLMYFDADGNYLTNTWHQTSEQAKHQAEFEFGISADEWEPIPASDSQ